MTRIYERVADRRSGDPVRDEREAEAVAISGERLDESSSSAASSAMGAGHLRTGTGADRGRGRPARRPADPGMDA
ncbi:hypothetical protein Aduo_009213 [Ancylostoma duodenale]